MKLDALGNEIIFGKTYGVSLGDIGSGQEYVSIIFGIAVKETPLLAK